MIDRRFSSESFEQKGKDTAQARELADRLADEVTEELRAIVEEKLRETIDRLNSMGHNLSLYEHDNFNASFDIAYRDDWMSDSDYNCLLRVAVGVVVSTGYSNGLYGRVSHSLPKIP